MREHILSVAENLFYREGIHAVGVDRVIREAGIAKATLYSHFPSKHELVLAYLAARSARVLATVQGTLSSKQGTSRELVEHLFDQLAQTAQPENHFRGCAFMLAVGESAGDPETRAIAMRHKARFREIFRSVLDRDFDDPDQLSERVAICYEGALTLVALSGNADSVPAAKSTVVAILAAAAPRSAQAS